MEAIGKKDGNVRSGTRRTPARNGNRTDAVQRAQRNFGLRFNVLTGNERQAPALSNRGQRQGCFHPGEGLSDALASAATERIDCIAMSFGESSTWRAANFNFGGRD